MVWKDIYVYQCIDIGNPYYSAIRYSSIEFRMKMITSHGNVCASCITHIHNNEYSTTLNHETIHSIQIHILCLVNGRENIYLSKVGIKHCAVLFVIQRHVHGVHDLLEGFILFCWWRQFEIVISSDY